MEKETLVPIQSWRTPRAPRRAGGKILLVKPPYFSPLTPPLSIASLKAFLEEHGYSARCFDYNADPELWGMHHKYFATLQTLENVSINDGYSKLWWIITAHMLAYVNGADRAACARVLETVIPMYGIRFDAQVIEGLHPLVVQFFRRLDELTDGFDLSGYAAVGTSTYTTSLASSLFLLRKLKREHPEITTVMGGGIFADDLALGSDNLETLLAEYPFVDHVILGEGELPLLKLLQGELTHKRMISLADVNGATVPMSDLPAPDFTDFNLGDYHHLTVEGARSCPFQCQFCSETVQWGDYRKKPQKRFAEQVIELARTYRNNTFFMGDSLMNPYIGGFASELLERNAKVLYDGYLRADKPVADRERVRHWARSGVYRVRLGIESASRRVLQSMDKMTTPEAISEALKSLASAGIRTTTYWIAGFPGETEEDFEETLDFIRGHHRYIYELEAHPYYYYPYGQMGSRLYQCYSIYPEEVTRVIKFKAWEITDANPTREERYDRLRRISQVAAELGLPNIYTMAERFEAEERWQALHPLAAEVYEDTRVSREAARLPEQPAELFSEEWGRAAAERGAGAGSVLCYHASVKRGLKEEILAASVGQLARFNEMLQVRLQDGKLVPAAGGGAQERDGLSAYSSRGEDLEAVKRRVVEDLSAGMRPEPGASLRVALINREDSSCDVLLLAHRAIADSRGVVLLCEDLFRVYEQLSEKREVSLTPVRKSYFELGHMPGPLADAREAAPRDAEASASSDGVSVTSRAGRQARPENQTVKSLAVRLDETLARRMKSEPAGRDGLTAAEVLVVALLRSLAITSGADEEGGHVVDVMHDYRSTDATLARTVGPLSCITRVSPAKLSDDGLLAGLRRVRQQLKETGRGPARGVETSQEGQKAGGGRRILLNLEYITDEPWLGGDAWAPQGFVVDEQGMREPYDIEVAPARRGGEVLVWLKYRDDAGVRALVEGVAAHLNREAEALFERVERDAAAKQYWMGEFGKGWPASSLEFTSGGGRAPGRRQTTAEREISRQLLDRLTSGCDAHAGLVILAAFGVLLSRLNGREQILLVSSLHRGGRTELAPLKLSPSWDLSFREFVQVVGRTQTAAFEHAAGAFDILAHDLPGAAAAGPVFDVGYIFADAAGEHGESAAGRAVEETCGRVSSAGQELALAAVFVDGGRRPALRFTYREGRLEPELVESLSAYLTTILDEVADDPNIRLGDIAFDGKRTRRAASDLLAKDVFNFGPAPPQKD